ncbi:MAG: 16S rRNA (cytidine(1402)-2'-O)-methyltransferase [Eubacterium sp.]|nr:16S rRNA (cytidine(1402)-2'-O)-methyltransferase [Eubacterium sp.]
MEKSNVNSGILYLVATPIGNLDDMTFRAVKILNEVDLIAAEDTRNSIKLLNHFEIKKPMTSYHEFNKYDKADVLIDKLLMGESIAVITDAGTPGISDPGEVLVDKAVANGIKVVPIPGACAAINALIASGQPTRRFSFEAFLPQDNKEREDVLTELKNETRTMIIYEAPHRLKKTLKELKDVFGEDRSLTICKEITKKHETFVRTDFKNAILKFEEEDPRGEYVLIIKGKSFSEKKEEETRKWEDITVKEHIEMYIKKGMSKKEAVKQVASDRNIPKRDVYQESIDL